MDVIVLGGGLAGLSTFHHLKSTGCNVTLYEKNSEPGGLCRSINIGGGFIFDYGPHLFFTKDKYVVKLMRSLSKVGFSSKKSNPGQYSFNMFIDYPYFTNLAGLPNNIIEECIAGFAATSKKQKKSSNNYFEWCYAYYGEGFAKYFMIPYAKKIWTIDLRRMTFDWVGKRIILPSIKAIKEGAYNKTNKMSNYIKYFRYPKKTGIENLPLSMIDSNTEIYYGKSASLINLINKTVKFLDGSIANYDCLVSSMPLNELVGIIKDVPKEIKKAASKLIHNSVLCLCLGLKETVKMKKQWLYFDDPKIPFNRISFQDKIGDGTVPFKNGSICVEIPYSKFKKINKRKAIYKSLKDLIRLGILDSEDQIVAKAQIDIKYAYAIFDHNREEAVSTIISYLEEKDIICVGRFGTWSYKWMHECILDGKYSAEKIKSIMRKSK